MKRIYEYIDLLFKLTKRICTYGVVLQGIFLLFMSFYICADVMARKLFAYSIKGSIELSGYALASMSGWIFSYALLTKAHVRIDVLYSRFPLAIRLILDIASYLSLLVFFIPLTYYSYHFFHTTFIRHSVANTPLHTPLWIPEGLWIAGLIFFVWVCFISLAKIVALIMKGEASRAHIEGGISTIEEEIEQEKAATQ